MSTLIQDEYVTVGAQAIRENPDPEIAAIRDEERPEGETWGGPSACY
jgi:hypothetical protein